MPIQLGHPVDSLPQISQRYLALLTKLEIHTIKDLLTHFPRYHRDSSEVQQLSDLEDGKEFVIRGRVESIASVRIRGGRTLQTGKLADESGSMPATWFNQPYLAKALVKDKEFIFQGKAKDYRGKLTLFPNTFEPVIEGREQVHLGRLAPQYALTAGISPKWLRNRLKYLIDHLHEIAGLSTLSDLLLDVLDKKYSGTNVLAALSTVHFPDSPETLAHSIRYLQLLELANLQLQGLYKRAAQQKNSAPDLVANDTQIQEFIATLPFELTPDQKQAVDEILKDITTMTPMYRLLQGDVGSGKTVVAVIAALVAHHAGYQTVVLAPTTVLANQHFLTFEKLLQDMPINLQLITASTKADEGGDILIGTSAVLARKDKLIKNLGLLVVDEQHRFGVSQREELLHPFEISNRQPHVLNMTATPIPRTLALALFSELEVSTINTKPKGRLPVKTFVVPEFKRPDSYSWIAKQLSENHEQAFWICPIIEESDVLQVNSAKQTYQHLQNIFPKLNIGLLHGKLTPKQKQEVMSEFAAGDITILVSTSVIEVGIDVPNATIMVIEGAERFGLAQLHQLRGRVGRSHQHSWCFLFPTEDTANTRLTYFASHSDGLKIAEYDLEQRGPGEVYGTRQSGIPNLKIARLNDLSLIKEAKKVADLFFESRIKQIDLF